MMKTNVLPIGLLVIQFMNVIQIVNVLQLVEIDLFNMDLMLQSRYLISLLFPKTPFLKKPSSSRKDISSKSNKVFSEHPNSVVLSVLIHQRISLSLTFTTLPSPCHEGHEQMFSRPSPSFTAVLKIIIFVFF
jgi:hypothetical protein